MSFHGSGHLPLLDTDSALAAMVRMLSQLVENLLAADPSGTTAQRPDPLVAGVGARFYDTTLARPLWSDGVVWRDAAGTAL